MSISPMNPRTAHCYVYFGKTPEEVIEPNASPEENEKPKVILHVAGSEEPLQPPYREISTARSATLLSSIIIANCFCSVIICICLWGFSKIDYLDKWQKRGFNTLSLLLSAALGFGIGFLCDQIGLLARGTILQSKPHSVKGVCASMFQ